MGCCRHGSALDEGDVWRSSRFLGGGGINTQNTFPFGTEEDVRREAQECLDIFAPGGGCVVNPIHNIQADVPIENILALYEMARQYSY